MMATKIDIPRHFYSGLTTEARDQISDWLDANGAPAINIIATPTRHRPLRLVNRRGRWTLTGVRYRLRYRNGRGSRYLYDHEAAVTDFTIKLTVAPPAWMLTAIESARDAERDPRADARAMFNDSTNRIVGAIDRAGRRMDRIENGVAGLRDEIDMYANAQAEPPIDWHATPDMGAEVEAGIAAERP